MVFEDNLNQQVEKSIEEHLPKIQEALQKTVSEPALVAAKDDAACEVMFTQVYKILPLPVRLLVKKDVFVKYCIANRDKLI